MSNDRERYQKALEAVKTGQDPLPYIQEFETAQAAFQWARSYGNQDIMRGKINEPEYAWWWAMYYPEDREYMEQFMTNDFWRRLWDKHVLGKIT